MPIATVLTAHAQGDADIDPVGSRDAHEEESGSPMLSTLIAASLTSDQILGLSLPSPLDFGLGRGLDSVSSFQIGNAQVNEAEVEVQGGFDPSVLVATPQGIMENKAGIEGNGSKLSEDEVSGSYAESALSGSVR